MRKLLSIVGLSLILITLMCCNSNADDKELDDEITHVDSLTKSNSAPTDTLVKYSYQLVLYRNGIAVNNATGFFIRKNKRLFLVSAYHVFTNQNTARKMPAPKPYDSLILIYKRQPDIKALYAVDLRKISSNSKSYFFFEYPDVYFYELTNLLHPQAIINSIDNFIKQEHRNNIEPKEIFTIGYGLSDIDLVAGIPKAYRFTLMSPIDSAITIQYGTIGEVNVKNSFFVNPKAMNGMSGAPVFYKGGSDENIIIFGGLISTHFNNQNAELIVKSNEVIKMLNQKLK